MYRSAFFSKPASQTAGATPVAPVVSESIVAQAAVTFFANQALNRTVKFPSSRKFLWDRTPLGRAEVVELKENLPIISVPSDFHSRVGPDRTALANVTCPQGSQLLISLQEAAPVQEHTHGLMVVPLTASPGGHSLEQVAVLLQNLQHSLERRGAGCLTVGLALGLALHSNSVDGSARDITRSSRCSVNLTATLLLPAVALSLTPLYAKRLCDVPLVRTLSQPSAGTNVQTGYLTMDQARSLLPLAADDSNVYSVPLVGVWVRGVRGTDHPAVFAAALQFAYGSTFPDRAAQPDGAFLMIVFTGGSPVARCYEARFSDPAAQPESRPQGHQAQNDLFSPGDGSGSIGGAATDGIVGCCGFGGSGLRVLPYLVKAELTGQAGSLLELKPMLDSVTAAASGARLTLLPRSMFPGQTPQRPTYAGSTALDAAATPHGGGGSGMGLGVRPHSVMAPSSTSRYDVHGILQLRGSGSKLMTSPSKAMKILAGESEGPYTGTDAPYSSFRAGTAFKGSSSGHPVAAVSGTAAATTSGWRGNGSYGEGGPATSLPWAVIRNGYTPATLAPRESPPVPRSSAVPTPFRAAPGHQVDFARTVGGYSRTAVSTTTSASGVSDSSRDGDIGGSTLAPPRDPRLQHRGAAAETPADRPASAVVGPRVLAEGRAWTRAAQGAMPFPPTASSDDMPGMPTLRVSDGGVPAARSVSSRSGSAEWGDLASGVMNTPAASLVRSDPQSVAATPRTSHDVTTRFAQLQQRLYTAGNEVMQQHLQEPQTATPTEWARDPMAWTAPDMLGNATQEYHTGNKSAPAAAKMDTSGTVAATVQQQQHALNSDSLVHGSGHQLRAALQGPSTDTDHCSPRDGNHGWTWRMREVDPGDTCVFTIGAGAAVVAADDEGVPRHVRGNSSDARYEQTKASTSNFTRSMNCVISGAAAASPLQCPAPLGQYPLQTRLQQPRQQQQPTYQGQHPSHGEAAAVYGVQRCASPALGHERLEEPSADPDCHLRSRHELSSHAHPRNLHCQHQCQPRTTRETQQSHHQHLQEQTNQHPCPEPSTHLEQSQHSRHGQHPEEQRQQRVFLGQVVPLEGWNATALPELGPEDDCQDNENLPMDPMLLKREVLQLRSQIASLQQQLRNLSCSACQQRFILTRECDKHGGPNATSCSDLTIRHTAAAIFSTAHMRPQAEIQKRLGHELPQGPDFESRPGNQTWPPQSAPNAEPSRCPAERPSSSSHSSGSGATGTDIQYRMPLRASQSSEACNNISVAAATPHCSSVEVARAAVITAAGAILDEASLRQSTRPASTIITSNAGDRAERMSVVSEASERGSVWSMASLHSSIPSYQSCLSSSTSRMSVDCSGSGLSGGSTYVSGAPLHLGDPVILRGKAGELARGAKDAGQSGEVSSTKESDCTSVLYPAKGGQYSAPSVASLEAPRGVQELLNSGSRSGSASGLEIPATPRSVTAATATSAAAPRPPWVAAVPTLAAEHPSVGPSENGRAFGDGQEAASRQSQTCLASTRSADRSIGTDYLGFQLLQRWELPTGSVGNRGRRRPRRSSSDSGSDSDRSLASEHAWPLPASIHGLPCNSSDEADIPARTSSAPSRAAQAPAATYHFEMWQAQPANATHNKSNISSASSTGLYGYPRVTILPAPAQSPQVSAGGSRSGVSLGPVVRTKYIPLDDDSDSGDSESDGLLEQKYGIRRAEV